METAIHPLNDKKIWDDFVGGVQPNTFLHSWQWGEFNQATQHEIHRFGIYGGESLLAVALILYVRARRGHFLFCPHGPIFKNDVDAPEVMAALTDRLVDLAKEKKCVLIRISPLLPPTKQNDELFFQLGYRNAPIHMAHPELGWILDLTATEDKLLAGMRKTTRYSIKKAEKDGVTVTMSTDSKDVETFWQVYQTTFARQHFTPFSKDYLRAEFETFARDNNAALFFAHYKGDVTATALIIFDEHSAYYHHAATTQKHAGLTDAQLLQWHIIQEAKRRGCSQYNFWGVVPEDGKRHPWTGLSIFKRGFGGREEAYVHAKDLVLSPRYWLTYTIEMTRRWKRRL